MRLRAETWRFSSSRRSTAPRPGRVGRRGVRGRSASPIMRASRSRAMRRFWCWLRSSCALALSRPAAVMRVRSRSVSRARCGIVEREVGHGDGDRHGAVGRVDVLAAGAAGARGAHRQRRIREGALAGGDRVVGRGVAACEPTAYHAACPASESASLPRSR